MYFRIQLWLWSSHGLITKDIISNTRFFQTTDVCWNSPLASVIRRESPDSIQKNILNLLNSHGLALRHVLASPVPWNISSIVPNGLALRHVLATPDFFQITKDIFSNTRFFSNRRCLLEFTFGLGHSPRIACFYSTNFEFFKPVYIRIHLWLWSSHGLITKDIISNTRFFSNHRCLFEFTFGLGHAPRIAGFYSTTDIGLADGEHKYWIDWICRVNMRFLYAKSRLQKWNLKYFNLYLHQIF